MYHCDPQPVWWPIYHRNLWDFFPKGYGLLVIADLWVMGQIPRPPSWWIKKVMGFQSLWVIWVMGYEGFYCSRRSYFILCICAWKIGPSYRESHLLVLWVSSNFPWKFCVNHYYFIWQLYPPTRIAQRAPRYLLSLIWHHIIGAHVAHTLSSSSLAVYLTCRTNPVPSRFIHPRMILVGNTFYSGTHQFCHIHLV